MQPESLKAVCHICLVSVFLIFGCPIAPQPDAIKYLIHYDFNDGTTQGWTVNSTSGGTTASVTNSGSGSLVIAVTYSGTNTIADFIVGPLMFNITGRDLIFRMKIPQNFLDNGYRLSFYVRDDSGNRAEKTVSLSGVTADTWYELGIYDIDSLSFDINPGTDLARIFCIGFALNQNGNINDNFTIPIDDVSVPEI